MFLTPYNLACYLTASGTITRDSVVDGDFAVQEAGRRNRNFKVLRRNMPGLFVKQIKRTEQQAIGTIEREARFCQSVQTHPALAPLSAVIPRFVHYDPQRYALTFLLADRAESVQERYLRDPRHDERISSALGKSLALVHGRAPAILADPALASQFLRQVPWPLTLHETGLPMLNAFGPIGPALAGGIQSRPALQGLLASLKAEWNVDALIHNDMKWDNCLVRTVGPGNAPQISIVDWELADVGDSSWDIGAILREYVTAVLVNRYARETAAAQNTAAPPPLQPEALQPSARAFWSGYCEGRGLSGYAADALLNKSVRMCGGRMIVGVLEYLAAAQQLGPLGEAMLDTSQNLLLQPAAAAQQIFGAAYVH
jgi:hypothetical protein